MLWQRLVFGSLMILALAGLVAADAWLSAADSQHPPGATTQTEVDIFHAIGQGSAPNFTVRGVVHTTVHANGNVTALVDHFTATGNCTP